MYPNTSALCNDMIGELCINYQMQTERGLCVLNLFRGAFDSAKNHKRQRRRKRQPVTAKREKSQTPKFVQVRLG